MPRALAMATREAIVARHQAGGSLPQIATELGVPWATVRRVLAALPGARRRGADPGLRRLWPAWIALSGCVRPGPDPAPGPSGLGSGIDPGAAGHDLPRPAPAA